MKREKIREIIDAHTDDQCLYLDGVCKFRSSDLIGAYCRSGEGAYSCLMQRLTELGVVIKVDKELPEKPLWAKLDNAEIKNAGVIYAASQHDMLRAGFMATEPLVEVCPQCGIEPHLCKCPTINRGSFAHYLEPLVGE